MSSKLRERLENAIRNSVFGHYSTASADEIVTLKVTDAALSVLSALVEDEEVVERVARAIHISTGNNSHWTVWEDEARAALRALTQEEKP